MDVAGILSAVAPQMGIGGVLLVLLGITMRHASTDRTDSRQALADAQARYAADLTAKQSECDGKQTQLDAAEEKLAKYVALYEQEREARWAAEAEAEQAKREAGNA